MLGESTETTAMVSLAPCAGSNRASSLVDGAEAKGHRNCDLMKATTSARRNCRVGVSLYAHLGRALVTYHSLIENAKSTDTFYLTLICKDQTSTKEIPKMNHSRTVPLSSRPSHRSHKDNNFDMCYLYSHRRFQCLLAHSYIECEQHILVV